MGQWGNEAVRKWLPGRRWAQAVGYVIVAVTASLPHCLSASFQGAASNWPQFRNTSTLNGVATSAIPTTLRLQWTYEAGSAVESSAAIVDGVAYVGTMAGKLVAVDAGTGKLKWSYTAASDDFGIGESSPAVAGGLVYIGDLSGVFHAVNVKDGAKAWTFKTGSEIKSSPVPAGGVVLIGSYDTHLYALDAKTGALKWKLKTDGQVHATPAVVDGTIYFGGCDEQFRAVRLADGKVLFSVPLDANTGSSTAIDGTRAYL